MSIVAFMALLFNVLLDNDFGWNVAGEALGALTLIIGCVLGDGYCSDNTLLVMLLAHLFLLAHLLSVSLSKDFRKTHHAFLIAWKNILHCQMLLRLVDATFLGF